MMSGKPNGVRSPKLPTVSLSRGLDSPITGWRGFPGCWASVLAEALETAASPALPGDGWLTIPGPYLKAAFKHVELALEQLDRYSGLAKDPVDYSQLTSGREA